MPLINLVVTLIVVGVLLWAVNTYIPMDRRIKQILNVVIVIAVVLWLLLGWWLALGTKSGQALEPGYSTSFCCPPLPLVDEKVALPCKNCLVPFHVPPCPRPSVRPSVRLAGSSNLHSSPPPLSPFFVSVITTLLLPFLLYSCFLVELRF